MYNTIHSRITGAYSKNMLIETEYKELLDEYMFTVKGSNYLVSDKCPTFYTVIDDMPLVSKATAQDVEELKKRLKTLYDCMFYNIDANIGWFSRFVLWVISKFDKET